MNDLDRDLVIIDESVTGKYVEALRKKGVNVIYVGHIDCCEKGMSDTEIMELGKTLGNVPIATYNYRHFKEYPSLIALKPNDSIYNHLRITQKAGIRIKGKLFI